MRNFVKGLVTNRFGIVLAALNICYFVSRKFVPFIFSNGCEDNLIIIRKNMIYWINIFSAKIMIYINSPAIMASIFTDASVNILTDFSALTQVRLQVIFFIFFITLQWLFIAWAAKTIAQQIRSI